MVVYILAIDNSSLPSIHYRFDGAISGYRIILTTSSIQRTHNFSVVSFDQVKMSQHENSCLMSNVVFVMVVIRGINLPSFVLNLFYFFYEIRVAFHYQFI